jgi:hypothetical protein
MTKDEFELLFNAEVAEPLCRQGFKRSGKSLYTTESLACVSLIRLGGRMARPGAIAHVLCCRMSFMRDRTEQVPQWFVSAPFDYPFKFLPTNLPAKLRYVPRNLNYDREQIDFQSRDRITIQRQRVAEGLVNNAWVRVVHAWSAYPQRPVGQTQPR